MAIKIINVSRINLSKKEKEEDKTLFDTLCNSIKEKGVLEPLSVTKIEGSDYPKYKLLDGRLRLLAAKAVGLKEVPCYIVEF